MMLYRTSPTHPPAGKHPRNDMSLEVPDRFPGVNVRLDQSLRNKPKHRGRLVHSTTDPDMSSIIPTVSPLPPAVGNVPADDIRGYAHSKKVYNYFVGATLGEGSFAKVKEAFNVLVGEKVAMKVIDKKKALQDAYVAKNFKREARLLQKVHHPNIVQLYEVIETENNYYLITELCTGGELMKHIYKHHHLSEDETRKYIRQIVSAVDHLHRAGILHRDLKVENLLLDHNMDIKLIDFGLSNEEYVRDTESGEEQHCRTQCGSPAYAAPELLGQKEYDKSVDVWSIGVNMYAMLTGALPYTVEPFNITALHAKMLQNKMNPIPSHLTDSCKDLLRRMLVSNPENRITMAEVFQHPWLSEKHRLPFQPAPYPNRITHADMNEDIIDHMVTLLKVDSAVAIKQDLIANKANSNSAIYHLLAARLARYQREFKNTHVRPTKRTGKKVSRDHGYYEDEDDAMSTATAPSGLGRVVSRGGKRPTHVHVGGTEVLLRTHPPRHHSRPISDIIPDAAPHTRHKNYSKLSSVREERRSSMPSNHPFSVMEFQKTFLKDRNHTMPVFNCRKMSPPADPLEVDIHSPDQLLSPLRHPPRHRMPASRTPENHDRLAWQSPEPSSLDNHRNHHFPLLNNSSGSDSASNGETLAPPGKTEFFIESPVTSELHLPDINPPSKNYFQTELAKRQASPGRIRAASDTRVASDSPTRKDRNTKTKKLTPPSVQSKPQRKLTPTSPLSGDFHLKTDLPTFAVVGELLRVADIMRMNSAESRNETTICCKHKHTQFEVSVTKSSENACRLHFEWLSGGSHRSFQEICEEVVQRVII